MANVIGPDISFYQDDPQTPEGIDFLKMRASAGYVIIRSGQNLWTDRDFKANWRESKLAGLPRGSYWFYDSRADPKKQAELWASVFAGDFGELPLFADFEENYGGAFKGWRHWQTFLESMKELVPGKEIGIYTAYYYWQQNAPNFIFQSSSLEYFRQYPLWIANYGVTTPLIPRPWSNSEWLFWQFTDKGNGRFYGVESGNIDLNYFNGDLNTFYARFKLTAPPEPDPNDRLYRVTAESLVVRAGPGLSYQQIGGVFLNDIVEEIGANSDRTWLKIRKQDGSVTGWSFSGYLQKTGTPTPPPTPIPIPEPPPPAGDKPLHRVTAASGLLVREGPGTTFKQIGSLLLNDIVEEIGANSNRTWLNIRKQDGSVTGWSSASYLQQIFTPAPTPTPTPTPEPPPPAGDKPLHRVTAASGLLVREGPGTNFTRIGSLLLNDIVEEIGANSNRSWLNIRKQDGSVTGWSSAAYLQQIFTPAPTPIPTPTPEPPPPTGDQLLYRVTAPLGLIVRQGPGLSFERVGGVLFEDVVERIGANSDESWLRIRKQDGSVTGWSFSAFLEQISPTIPPAPVPPPNAEDKNWYRVTASSLKVREGPGLDYDAIGQIHFSELVEKIGASVDGSWLNIRNVDGSLVGWSSSEYLQSVSAPPPVEPTPVTPVPDHSDKNWYRINTVTLVIRETPSTSAKIMGTVLKNDTVPALDDSSNTNWVKIQKIDGITGWCEKRLMVFLENTRPNSIRQSLFPGITYIRQDLLSARPVVAHVMTIDLQTPKLEFLVTPSTNSGTILCTRTTSKFLEEFKLSVAINGGYYHYLDADYKPATYCPNGGDPVRVTDFAASRGKIYSPKKTIQPTIYIKPRNQVSFDLEEGRTFNAISGDRMIVENGKVVKNLADAAPNPRTAIGLSKNVRWLTLMVVDGRQPNYSEGVTMPELAELLISHGAHTGANMDGGGSSAMVIKGLDGKARILNSPIDLNKPGKERAVANHLGLYFSA
jgi:GH25 family lysozyme M1 (1,4-beta-N-acetylmuramidase)/uncharacterized protein YraI